MSEEEKKAIRTKFQNILNGLNNNKIAPTGTALLNAEQPMILLFEELINKIEKQQKEIKALNIALITATLKIEGLKIEAVYNNNYISKDKIREKIKELEKEAFKSIAISEKINVLKELLEENNND